MRRWERHVREQLPLPEMKREREERIVQELADHLEDLYRNALAQGCGEEDAVELVRRRLGDMDVGTCWPTSASTCASLFVGSASPLASASWFF